METRIYIASVKSLEDNATFEKLCKTVPDYRKKKISAYKTAKDKRLCLGSGLILSRALKDAGIDESSLEIAYKESGKPYFKDAPFLNFSISHSEERVMCAISELPIGCDVEFIGSNNPEEVADWTKKESYVKASDIEMIRVLSEKLSFDDKFLFKDLSLNDGYCYSICAEEKLLDKQIVFLKSL